MQMQSRYSRSDESAERAVSPVIGVILMVAITVILAAVIAAFVLDIGPGETAPTAQMDAEIEEDENGEPDDLRLIHNGGDSFEAGDIIVSVQGEDSADTDDDELFNPAEDEDYSSDDVISTGDVIEVDVGDLGNGLGSGETVQVIHNPSDGIVYETTVDFD